MSVWPGREKRASRSGGAGSLRARVSRAELRASLGRRLRRGGRGARRAAAQPGSNVRVQRLAVPGAETARAPRCPSVSGCLPLRLQAVCSGLWAAEFRIAGLEAECFVHLWTKAWNLLLFLKRHCQWSCFSCHFGIDGDVVPVLCGLVVILKVFKHGFYVETLVSKNIM